MHKEVTFENIKKKKKENNYSTALTLCSETSPSQIASKLIASTNLGVLPTISVPSAATLASRPLTRGIQSLSPS